LILAVLPDIYGIRDCNHCIAFIDSLGERGKVSASGFGIVICQLKSCGAFDAEM